MKWPEFLRQIAQTGRITLIGPLYGRPHTPENPSIYIDGGDRFRPTRPADKNLPLVSVGDGDSSTGAPDELLPADKNYSDLAFALRNLPDSVNHLDLLGFLGGRRDHELLNLGEINAFLAGRKTPTRVNFEDDGRIAIIAFTHSRLELPIDGFFSVVTFTGGEVEVGGACRFPFKGILPAVSSHGLSNQGSGLVTVAGAGPYFIFLN